jgi:hypothetical protein
MRLVESLELNSATDSACDPILQILIDWFIRNFVAFLWYCGER